MLRVVVLEDWNRAWASAPQMKRLEGKAEVKIYTDQAGSLEETVRRLSEADVVVVNRERTRLDARFFKALPNLKLVAQTGDGLMHVDLEAATRNGTLVTTTRSGYFGMVEFTIGAMIGAMRRLAEQDRALRAGTWPLLVGQELTGKTLGILGLGRIGKAVARVAEALGMRIIAAGLTLTPERAAEGGAEFRTIDQLMAEADVVSVHFKLSDRTRGIISRERLAMMKPTAVLVNTARGPIVDEEALVEALLAGRIAGAAIDVYGTEPLPASHPLLGCQTAFLTAHTGWVTDTAYNGFVEGVVGNIEAYLAGNPTNVKNPEALAAAC